MDRINKAQLDPLPLYDKIDVILAREEKKVPEREGEETDEDYRERLIQVCGLFLDLSIIGFVSLTQYVKQELPLQRGQQNAVKEQQPQGDQQQAPQPAQVAEDQG